MLDLTPIKERLSKATPGPWAWRQDAFLPKYMDPVKSKPGHWRARSKGSAKRSWVMLLTGPQQRILKDELPDELTPENVRSGLPDEWDFPHIIALRWSSIKGNTLFNATPCLADAELVANAPSDIAALIGEVERLRAALAQSGTTSGVEDFEEIPK